MTALTRKLLRDLWSLRFQGFTIALLIGCGIASLVASIAAYESLRVARDRFYDSAHFADVFVQLNRAPLPVLDRLRDVPGVSAVMGRVAGDYRLLMPDTTEAVTGHFVGLPAAREESLNELAVEEGRNVEPGSSTEVVVSNGLAGEWHIRPGFQLSAIINGRLTTLQVVGIGTSPEFIYLLSRAGITDIRHVGVIWMDGKALARAMGMSGEFNDVAIQLINGADGQEVMRQVDHVLEPYGGLGAVDREHHPSGRLVDQKILQQKKLGVVLPALFLAVSAFLLNILLHRIVSTQREQIATMKALGYRTRELMFHYLALAAAVCLFGIAIGLGLGVVFGRFTVGVLGRFFHFPGLDFRIDPRPLVIGGLVAMASALVGAYFGVRHAVRIPPAEAMRPEPPPSYKPTTLERLGLYRYLPPVLSMVLRDVERRPFRLLLSAASIALAVAITLLGGVMGDSIEETLRLQYEVAHREDITLTFDKARAWRAIRDLNHIPGVLKVEGERYVPVRLRAGPRDRTTAIVGIAADAELHQLLGMDKRKLDLPIEGISLSRVLGDELGVKAGDEIEVEVLEERRQKLRLPVAALVDDLIGFSAYMELSRLNALLNEVPSANVALLSVERPRIDAVNLALLGYPAVANISQPDVDRALIRTEVLDTFIVMQIMLALFAAAIGIGVVYNNARIALEMRSRDLATMRILGFNRSELAVVLFSEQVLQLALGIWPGLVLGFALGAGGIRSIDRELMRVPATLSGSSRLAGVCVVLVAALISAILVRRRSDHLDLVAVLKARD